MNDANLRLVRRFIHIAEPSLVDMSDVGAPGCGTPGCIIGWALYASGNPSCGDWKAARNFMDLEPKLFDRLTLANFADCEIARHRLTKQDVLTAIDSVLANPNIVMPNWPPAVQRMIIDDEQ